MVDCTTIPTVELVQESKKNMDTINQFIYSTNPLLIDQYGQSRKTLRGYEIESQQKVNDVVYDATQTVLLSQQYANEALGYRNTTLGYRDETFTARDVTEGYRDETFTARDVTEGYRDETFTARDVTEGYRDETQQLLSQTLATSNFKGEWSNLSGPLTGLVSLYHNNQYWMLLVDLVDVTLSEPSMSNSDYAPLTLGSNRLGITPPFVVTLPGNYFIRSNGDVTLPITTDLTDESYNFVSAIGSQPVVIGEILTQRFGNVDGVILDDQKVYEFIYNPLSGKLEV